MIGAILVCFKQPLSLSWVSGTSLTNQDDRENIYLPFSVYQHHIITHAEKTTQHQHHSTMPILADDPTPHKLDTWSAYDQLNRSQNCQTLWAATQTFRRSVVTCAFYQDHLPGQHNQHITLVPELQRRTIQPTTSQDAKATTLTWNQIAPLGCIDRADNHVVLVTQNCHPRHESRHCAS
jgi:hypothetical protein